MCIRASAAEPTWWTLSWNIRSPPGGYSPAHGTARRRGVAFSNHATPALITPCSADRSHATRLIQWGRCESAPPTTFLSALS